MDHKQAKRLRNAAESVKSAFFEGWASYNSPACAFTSDDDEWEKSIAKVEYDSILSIASKLDGSSP